MLVRPRRQSYAVDVRMWTSLSLFLPSLLVAQERLHDDMSHGRGHRDTLSIGRMPRLHDACCPSHNNKRLTCNPEPTNPAAPFTYLECEGLRRIRQFDSQQESEDHGLGYLPTGKKR